MKSITMDPDITAYLRDITRRGLRPATVTLYRKALRACSARIETPMRDATPEQLEEWLYSNPNAAARTRATYYRCLSAFYVWMVRTHRVDRDPTDTMIPPRSPQSRPRPIPEEDLREALTAAMTLEMRAWLTLGAFAGLRAGEVARLRREDVRPRSNPPVVEVINGKGGADRRVIVGRVVIAALGPFLSRRGALWDATPEQVTKRVSRHFQRLEMPWTMHGLRHTYATRIYGVSNDIRLTQELMGHSSPATTAIYAAVDHDAAARAVAMIEEGWAA